MHSYRVAQKWAEFSTNLSSIDKSGHQTNLKGTQFAVCACTSAPTKRKKSEVTLGIVMQKLIKELQKVIPK